MVKNALASLVSIAVLYGAALSGASAQSLQGFDTNTPIEITADALEVMQKEQKAIFKGKVHAKQGVMQLTADSMTVHYHTAASRKSEGQGVSKIETNGNVFLTTPDETARGQYGEYDVDGHAIHMRGNVVLTRGENVITGDKLDYNLVSGESKVTAGGATITGEDGQPQTTTSGGRVRGVFIPEGNQ